MQPLCSLHVLLLSQGQNWIAAGDCIFPYAWHVHCIVSPHVSLSCVPFSYKIVLCNWKERVLNSYFLILLTCLLTIITLGLSILRTPIYPLYAITLGFCWGHCSGSNATWLQWDHRRAFSFLSSAPSHRQAVTASPEARTWMNHWTATCTSADQHHCQAQSQAWKGNLVQLSCLSTMEVQNATTAPL